MRVERQRVVRVLSGLLVVTAVAVVGVGCRLIDELYGRKAIREAKELYQKEEYLDACTKFEEAMALIPDDVNLKQSLAFCYMALFKPNDQSPENIGLVDKSAALLQEILAARAAVPDQPENPKQTSSEKLGEALLSLYLNADRHAEAVAFLEQQLAAKPADVETMKKIATIYVEARDLQKAFEWYRKWAEVDASAAQPWYTIGFLAWKKVYCDERRCDDPTIDTKTRTEFIMAGLESLDGALKIDPNNADVYAYLNLLYREKAKFTDRGTKAAVEDLKLADEYRDKAQELYASQKKKEREEETLGDQAPPAEEGAKEGA